MKKILVIAPHADDEVLGCGATIKKKILEGHEVFVLIMTNAHVGMPEYCSEKQIETVRAEALAAHKFLGVRETIFKDFPAPVLDQFPIAKIAPEISEVIHKHEIQIVYIPHRGDIHIDHKVIFDAALVACRPINSCPVKEIYAYETLSETEWAHPFASSTFIPTVFEKIDVTDFNCKLEAFKFFKSQIREFPASRSIEAIEALAKFRGATVSSERAEAFMVMRIIR